MKVIRIMYCSQPTSPIEKKIKTWDALGFQDIYLVDASTRGMNLLPHMWGATHIGHRLSKYVYWFDDDVDTAWFAHRIGSDSIPGRSFIPSNGVCGMKKWLARLCQTTMRTAGWTNLRCSIAGLRSLRHLGSLTRETNASTNSTVDQVRQATKAFRFRYVKVRFWRAEYRSGSRLAVKRIRWEQHAQHRLLPNSL